MDEAIFRRQEGGFVPTPLARGPWDPGALHGGAAAALVVHAIEQLEPGSELALARLTLDFVRPIPIAPLTLSLETVRPGRRVQSIAGDLRAGGESVCRIEALRLNPVPAGVPRSGPPGDALPPPHDLEPTPFTLDGSEDESFARSAIEMRFVAGGHAPGPSTVWMRLRVPVLEGHEPSPLVSLAAAADFGNGVGAALPFTDFLFINADLDVQLHRHPRGEWVALQAQTVIEPGEPALAESVLHDLEGPVGRAQQSLLVQPR